MLKELAENCTPENLDKLSIKELEALTTVIHEEKQSLRKYQVMISAVINKKEVAESAKRDIATMSDEKKKALLQELTGSKTETEESVKSSQ